MPSPFPGMDPYLEAPAEWPSLHHELSSEIARQLAPKLSPKYVARTERRVYTESPVDVGISRSMFPDVGIYETPSSPSSVREKAAAIAPEAVEIATVITTQIPHVSIHILDVDRRELVTAIEVLSPTNKRGQGYQEYLEKRDEIFHSQTHLIEIDLLREGRRIPTQQPLPPAPYYVFLSRVQKRPVMNVWPIQFYMRLPEIPVPLFTDDPDVTLDLQKAFVAVYDTFRYDLSVGYTHPPVIPLDGKAAMWAEEVVKAKTERG